MMSHHINSSFNHFCPPMCPNWSRFVVHFTSPGLLLHVTYLFVLGNQIGEARRKVRETGEVAETV